MRAIVIGAVAAVSVLGVVAPATAQAAPRSIAAVPTWHHHHHHCDGDQDGWWFCCDRDDDGWGHHHHCHHGVEAGGGGMATLVTSRTSHLGA